MQTVLSTSREINSNYILFYFVLTSPKTGIMDSEKFISIIKEGYSFEGEHIKIGAGMLEGAVIKEAAVSIPLSTMNRHGLVSGATGGGKTKSFQLIAEGLSNAGVPVLLLDIKGDMSGLAVEGARNEKIDERYQLLDMNYQPCTFPVEILTLSGQNGVRLRATVSEFGPILLSKILGLNETQESIVSVIFKFCDDRKLPLLDLKDFKKVLRYAGDEGKDAFEKDYGKVSSSSLGVILRNVIELEGQGADIFFGEKSFEVKDLLGKTYEGKGVISILRVNDIQGRPKLFSTFMLQLLAEIYATMPEEGDLPKPKLIFFIDEAHLIFSESGKALLNQLEIIIKLIRSKGVGIYFCTQNPTDIPQSILGQLGMKIQHSLRAFTARDRKAIKQTAENYPLSEFYETENVITQLGIGEALVTLLNEKGRPTPLVRTMMCTPASRMDTLSPEELAEIIQRSRLAGKYNQVLDTLSAYEMLSQKLDLATQNAPSEKPDKENAKEKEENEAKQAV